MKFVNRCIAGLPYLEKELARRASLWTGRALTTPSVYYVIFSGRCNLACPFCYIHRHPDPILPEEVMLRIIREAKGLSGRGFNISLSGGEPLIYPAVYPALELAHKLGVNFGFTTNALGLTKANVQRVVACDPFNINISIESVDPAINEALRPFPGGTRRALEAISDLVAEKRRVGSRVSLIIKPTIMEQNYRTLPDLVRHFGKNSGVQINFQPFGGPRDEPYWVKDLDRLKAVLEELDALRLEDYPIIGDQQTFEGFLSYLKNPPPEGYLGHLDLRGRKRNCDIGLRSMFIFPNGDVHACDFLKQPLGNMHNQTLPEIYRGKVASDQRRRMMYCDIDCQQTCKRPVPLWVKAKVFLRMG